MSLETRERLADRIKREVRILDVASDYAPSGAIKRRGRLHVCQCLCGQNSDRNPSFTLYEADNHFHCFACGRHGSVIDLIMLTEGLDFKAAMERLRGHYLRADGSDIQPRRVMQRAPIPMQSPITDEVRAVLDAATTYYQSALGRAPTVLRYLHERGLNDEMIRRLRIGYSDGGLGRALFAQGVDLATAARIGLLSSHGEHLHSRIVFPVGDSQDRPVWMIGRALAAEMATKYLGLPDGLVHKQPMVMGAARHGSIWVEGAFDLAALVQWGLSDDYLLIGLLGTAFEAVVQHLLPRLPPNACICTDQDAAGKQAALKLATVLAAHGIQPRVFADADRHALVSAWVARTEKKRRLSDRERKKLTEGTVEVETVQALTEQRFIRWVRWANTAKDPGDLGAMGERGRTMFLDGLASA